MSVPKCIFTAKIISISGSPNIEFNFTITETNNCTVVSKTICMKGKVPTKCSEDQDYIIEKKTVCNGQFPSKLGFSLHIHDFERFLTASDY